MKHCDNVYSIAVRKRRRKKSYVIKKRKQQRNGREKTQLMRRIILNEKREIWKDNNVRVSVHTFHTGI